MALKPEAKAEDHRRKAMSGGVEVQDDGQILLVLDADEREAE
jgi:hypothetical protein